MTTETWIANTAAKAAATINGDELLRVVDDPAGTPASRKVAISAVKDYILGLANTWTAQNIFAQGVLTVSAPTTFSQTWNAAGVTFIGQSIDITSTASAVDSLPFRVRVGGSPVFSVRKDGAFTSLLVRALANTDIYDLNGNSIIGRFDGTNGGLNLGTFLLAFGADVGQRDVGLARNAADVLEVNSGTAGTLRDLLLRQLIFSAADVGLARNAAGVLEVNSSVAGTLRDILARNLTLTAGTLTDSTPSVFSQTWNDAADTFIGHSIDITDTASAVNSILFRARSGSDVRFGVTKEGTVFGKSFTFPANGDANTISIVAGGLGADTAAIQLRRFIDGNTAGPVVVGLAFASAINFAGATDVRGLIIYEADDTLALRRDANAQIWRWYHTWTDASNYQRGALKTGSDYVELAAETAGTGGDNLDIRLTPAGTGNVQFGTHTALGSETVTGFITIKDAAGNSRKVAVVS